jgi:hypothetical protein
MARDNTIALSDEEKEILSEARLDIFGTDEVPYGVVISTLCEDV